MAAALERRGEFRRLKARLKTLLPEEYRESFEDVRPVSMGSAGLKYDEAGRVAWDQIWQSFCDLAMAGGPPHRGTLLECATKAEIELEPERYGHVVDELCRGVQMVTGLAAEPSPVPGWIDVDCPSTGMAGWLVRAITMENVAAHVDGMILHLPAGPGFRLEKEIKNVVTSIAKTCHYWRGHTSVAQHRAIAELFHVMDGESPLIQPPFSTRTTPTASFEELRDRVAAEILSRTGLKAALNQYHGWLGLDCRTVQSAMWMMRLTLVSNVLARREDSSLYIPVDASVDRNDTLVAGVVARAYRIASAQGLVEDDVGAGGIQPVGTTEELKSSP